MLLDLRVRTCDLGALIILNTELNDLRLIISLRKIKFLLNEFQFVKSLKIWWSMADIVFHAPANFQ